MRLLKLSSMASPDLSNLVKTGLPEADPSAPRVVLGESIRWRIQVENQGDGTAENVRILDELNPQLILTSQTVSRSMVR